MKTKLHVLVALMLTISMVWAQETTVNTSLSPGYANQLYYKLSTETEAPYAANSWDIALLRTSTFSIGIRVNAGTGTEVFEASNNPSDWSTIDVANEGGWTKLNNDDTSWTEGAFDRGSATYGWGEYNPATHHVVGTVIFVLKYADGSYRKFINEDFFGGYTFKYSTWDSGTSTWGTDETATVANSNNPNNRFNYYSFENDTEVSAAPAINAWDIKFTKYYTEIPDGSGDTVYYPVTGVLFNEGLEVAENDEPSGMPSNPSLTYSTDINTIGYDWKSFSFSTGWSVDANKAFYVKYADDTVYRLYFSSFSGSSTGDLTFNFEDVTASLSIDDVSDNVSFEIYPNPSTDKQINLVYDVNQFNTTKNDIAIYTTTGQKVFQTALKSNSGFYNKMLDLSSLSSGIYVLQISSGDTSTSKKLVLN